MTTNEQAVKPTHTLAPIRAGQRGLVLTGLEDMYRFAQWAVKSGMVPQSKDTPEKCVIAMQMGAEVGLSPMSSLQLITVINGKPSLGGDALLGLCRQNAAWDEGQFQESFEGQQGTDEFCAVCQCGRKGGNPITQEFSVADAKRAGLWGSANWKKYPRRMLQWRARGFALRDGFADSLSGIISAEEASDYPIDVSVAQPQEAEIVSAPSSSAATRAKRRLLKAKPEEPTQELEPDSSDEAPQEAIEILDILAKYDGLPDAVQKMILVKHKLDAIEDASATFELAEEVRQTLADVMMEESEDV